MGIGSDRWAERDGDDQPAPKPDRKPKPKVKMVKLQAEQFDTLLTQKWLNGKHHADDEVIAVFQKKATEHFLRGDDAKAKLFRDEIPAMLKEVFAKLEQDAQKHEKDYGVDAIKVIEFEE